MKLISITDLHNNWAVIAIFGGFLNKKKKSVVVEIISLIHFISFELLSFSSPRVTKGSTNSRCMCAAEFQPQHVRRKPEV